MNIIYRNFIIYFGVLFLSVAVFYVVNGRFETDFFGFPTLWTGWFYFLYIAIPLYILIRTLYRRLIKKETFALLKNSIVFLIGLSFVHVSYWLMVNTYKASLFHDVKSVEAKIGNETNGVNFDNVNVQYELNKNNKNRSYKISFTTLNKSSYKAEINIQGFVFDTDKRIFSRTLLLLPDKKVQNHYLYISEKYFRDKVTSKDTLDFKVSYTVDFPRDKYKLRTELAQQWCTWSIIGCSKTKNEVSWHDTELFDSTIFQLPYKINSAEKALVQVKLGEFTNLDLLLPFSGISFLSEEITIKRELIQMFYLKFNVHSLVDGNIYSQISSAQHADKLLNIPLEYKTTVSKGKNVISIPVAINELSTLMNKQEESAVIKFDLFISNNRSWYCPDFVCEINNHPSQLKRFVVTTKNKYQPEDFPKE